MAMFGKDRVAVATPPPMEAPSMAPAMAPSNGTYARPQETSESVFGPTIVFKGEINFQDAIRVEGEIHGRILGEGRVTVSERGKVFGDIVAAQVVVQGVIQGNVTAADRLEVAASGQVAGDIKCSRLVIADGAKLIGRLDVGSESMTFSPPAPKMEKAAESAEAAEPDALGKVF